MVNIVRTLPILLAESAGQVAEQIEIIRCGVFDHELYGVFDVTPEILQSFVKNFQDGVRGIDIAVDYGHDSGGPAAGWIKALSIKDNALWGQVQWTSEASTAIADRKWRYISADFVTSYQDSEGSDPLTKAELGPTLFGAALTNRPFVKKMAPIVQLTEGDDMSKAPAPAPADPKDQEIEALKKQVAELLAASQKKADDAPAPAVNEDNPTTQDKPGQDDTELSDLKQKLADLQQKCDDMEMAAKKAKEQTALAEKSAQFNKMLSEGRVVEAQRKPWMEGDMVKFAETMTGVKLSQIGHGDSQAEADDNNDVEQAVLKKACALQASDARLSLGAAIRKVLSEDQALNAKYQAKFNR